jgi:biopolymer transport protein ExbD
MADPKDKMPDLGAISGDVSSDEDWAERKKAEANLRRKKRGMDDKAELMITSLMDIMTILLVFLIISATSDPLNVTQGLHMQLAGSTANTTPKDDSIPIMITRAHIVLDNKGIVSIRCTIDKGECTEQDFEKLNLCEAHPDEEICSKEVRFEVDKQDKEKSDPNSLIIEPLRKELEQLVKQQIEENEALGRKFKGIVTLIADKEIPFRLLMEVIYTAGKVGVKGKGGLSQFRFAILRTGSSGD